jgi:REP element-mobilizing transposase RayT
LWHRSPDLCDLCDTLEDYSHGTRVIVRYSPPQPSPLQCPGETYWITWRVVDGITLEPDDRSSTLDAIRHWDGDRWSVYAAVVMPDHIHILARPLTLNLMDPLAGPVHDLGDILGSIKKFSARRINLRHGRSGALWQDERYDRIVRDDREFEEKWLYLRTNPVKAGLVEKPEDYPWLYEAGQAG